MNTSALLQVTPITLFLEKKNKQNQNKGNEISHGKGNFWNKVKDWIELDTPDRIYNVNSTLIGYHSQFYIPLPPPST